MIPKLKNLKVGIDVEYVSQYDFITGVQRVFSESSRFLYSRNTDQIEFLGVMTNQSKQSSNFKKNTNLKSNPILNSKLANIEDLDILISLDHNVQINFQKILEIKRKRKFPCIFLIHDVIPLHFPEYFSTPNAKRNYQIYLQMVFQVADVLVVPSEKVKRDLLSLEWHFKGEIIVNYLGAFEFNFNTQFEGPSLNLLNISCLQPRKGILDLIDAFSILIKKGIDVNLNLVGNRGWSDGQIYSSILKHKNFGSRLKWFPAATDSEIKHLYKSTSLVVISSYEEGFGLGLEEALANHRRVLVRNIDVFLERQQPNVHFFDGNSLNLATKIEGIQSVKWEPNNQKIRSMNDFSAILYDIVRRIIN